MGFRQVIGNYIEGKDFMEKMGLGLSGGNEKGASMIEEIIGTVIWQQW